jgi:hypothetical protein
MFVDIESNQVDSVQSGFGDIASSLMTEYISNLVDALTVLKHSRNPVTKEKWSEADVYSAWDHFDAAFDSCLPVFGEIYGMYYSELSLGHPFEQMLQHDCDLAQFSQNALENLHKEIKKVFWNQTSHGAHANPAIEIVMRFAVDFLYWVDDRFREKDPDSTWLADELDRFAEFAQDEFVAKNAKAASSSARESLYHH